MCIDKLLQTLAANKVLQNSDYKVNFDSKVEISFNKLKEPQTKAESLQKLVNS